MRATRPARSASCGVHHAAGQDQVHRLRLADRVRQPLRAADAGNDAELDFRLAEFGVVGGDDEIALHGKLAAAAERKAGDRGNDRLARLRDAVPGRREIAEEDVGEFLVRHLLDVGAGRKRLLRAGDDHAADIAVGLERIDRRAQVRASARALSALSACGRLSRMRPTRPRVSTMMFSVLIGSLPVLSGSRFWQLLLARRTIKRRAAVLHDAFDGAAAARRPAGSPSRS